MPSQPAPPRCSIHYIEVWGVKKTRPAFTYRVRERQLRIVELTAPSYKEMAATLHMCVFALLAQREGKPKRAARAEGAAGAGSDHGRQAQAAKAAARDAADEAAATGLPHGWSVIQDPITGQTAYWNQVRKQASRLTCVVPVCVLHVRALLACSPLCLCLQVTKDTVFSRPTA